MEAVRKIVGRTPYGVLEHCPVNGVGACGGIPTPTSKAATVPPSSVSRLCGAVRLGLGTDADLAL